VGEERNEADMRRMTGVKAEAKVNQRR